MNCFNGAKMHFWIKLCQDIIQLEHHNQSTQNISLLGFFLFLGIVHDKSFSIGYCEIKNQYYGKGLKTKRVN